MNLELSVGVNKHGVIPFPKGEIVKWEKFYSGGSAGAPHQLLYVEQFKYGIYIQDLNHPVVR